MKKPVKIGLWLLFFAVLGVLGLWLEHERAKARLAAFKADLIAKGERLAIADHVPKLPPALSNAAPDFIAAANRLTELKPEFQPQRMHLVAPGKARVTWQQPELPTEKEPDLWPFITVHMEDNRHLLAEMAPALERRELVFNLDYTKGFNLLLPHLAKHKAAATLLANAVLVELHTEQRDTALTNLLTAVRLLQLNEEPILISQLVRAACGHIASTATWEALQSPGLQDSQLLALQVGWQAWDMKRGWLAAMHMERAIGVDIFAQCRINPETIEQLGSVGFSSSSFFDALWNHPDEAVQRAVGFSTRVGWAVWFSYEDERWTLNWHQTALGAARQAHQTDAVAAPFTRLETAAKSLATIPTPSILSRMLLPATERIQKKFAMFEAIRRLTFTAIALHRHRLKHGQFPASLAALVPEFLAEVPRDFMDGQPLRYRLEPDGQFRLWSVGEDFKDDGGDATTVGAPSNNPFDWLKGRDWVWPQPATEAQVAAYHAELDARRVRTVPPPPPAPSVPGLVPSVVLPPRPPRSSP